MNPSEFEKRLQRTPLRQPPTEWRKEILAASERNRHTNAVRGPTCAATWQRKLRELFWPHPIAWGAIAALWMAIALVRLALQEPASTPQPHFVAVSPGVPTVMELQRQLLVDRNTPGENPRTKPEPSLPPQSCIERRHEHFEV